ncbi:8709_t:CDS:2, partial [Cetraspora pellucida]
MLPALQDPTLCEELNKCELNKCLEVFKDLNSRNIRLNQIYNYLNNELDEKKSLKSVAMLLSDLQHRTLRN